MTEKNSLRSAFSMWPDNKKWMRRAETRRERHAASQRRRDWATWREDVYPEESWSHDNTVWRLEEEQQARVSPRWHKMWPSQGCTLGNVVSRPWEDRLDPPRRKSPWRLRFSKRGIQFNTLRRWLRSRDGAPWRNVYADLRHHVPAELQVLIASTVVNEVENCDLPRCMRTTWWQAPARVDSQGVLRYYAEAHQPAFDLVREEEKMQVQIEYVEPGSEDAQNIGRFEMEHIPLVGDRISWTTATATILSEGHIEKRGAVISHGIVVDRVWHFNAGPGASFHLIVSSTVP